MAWAKNETCFIRFTLCFSFHKNTGHLPKSCAGSCLYFIIKVVATTRALVIMYHLGRQLRLTMALWVMIVRIDVVENDEWQAMNGNIVVGLSNVDFGQLE